MKVSINEKKNLWKVKSAKCRLAFWKSWCYKQKFEKGRTWYFMDDFLCLIKNKNDQTLFYRAMMWKCAIRKVCLLRGFVTILCLKKCSMGEFLRFLILLRYVDCQEGGRRVAWGQSVIPLSGRGGQKWPKNFILFFFLSWIFLLYIFTPERVGIVILL